MIPICVFLFYDFNCETNEWIIITSSWRIPPHMHTTKWLKFFEALYNCKNFSFLPLFRLVSVLSSSQNIFPCGMCWLTKRMFLHFIYDSETEMISKRKKMVTPMRYSSSSLIYSKYAYLSFLILPRHYEIKQLVFRTDFYLVAPRLRFFIFNR